MQNMAIKNKTETIFKSERKVLINLVLSGNLRSEPGTLILPVPFKFLK